MSKNVNLGQVSDDTETQHTAQAIHNGNGAPANVDKMRLVDQFVVARPAKKNLSGSPSPPQPNTFETNQKIRKWAKEILLGAYSGIHIESDPSETRSYLMEVTKDHLSFSGVVNVSGNDQKRDYIYDMKTCRLSVNGKPDISADFDLFSEVLAMVSRDLRKGVNKIVPMSDSL